jgi:hypothetical protein
MVMTAVDRRYRITEFMRCIKEGIGFLIYHGDGEMGIFVAIVMGVMFIPLFIEAEGLLIMKILLAIIVESPILSIPFLVMFIDAFRYCCSCHSDCAHEYRGCLDDCKDHIWLRVIGVDESRCVMGCESSFYSCIYRCNHDFDP